jgi:hypothetical protein
MRFRCVLLSLLISPRIFIPGCFGRRAARQPRDPSPAVRHRSEQLLLTPRTKQMDIGITAYRYKTLQSQAALVEFIFPLS